MIVHKAPRGADVVEVDHRSITDRSPMRVSIAGIMAAVVLAALDCVAIQSPLSGRSRAGVLLLFGALPMANILMLGLLPLLRARTGRQTYPSGWVGFEAGGWTALLLYAAVALYQPDPLLRGVVSALAPLRVHGNSAFLAAVGASLSAPQLGSAVLACWLDRKGHVRSLFADRGPRRSSPGAWAAGPGRT
jgi:hypothetical protein